MRRALFVLFFCLLTLAGYAGEDDAGTPSYRVGPLNGVDGLSLDAAGSIYASARQDGAVLLVERQ